jgi:hypothetical protein
MMSRTSPNEAITPPRPSSRHARSRCSTDRRRAIQERDRRQARPQQRNRQDPHQLDLLQDPGPPPSRPLRLPTRAWHKPQPALELAKPRPSARRPASTANTSISSVPANLPALRGLQGSRCIPSDWRRALPATRCAPGEFRVRTAAAAHTCSGLDALLLRSLFAGASGRDALVLQVVRCDTDVEFAAGLRNSCASNARLARARESRRLAP